MVRDSSVAVTISPNVCIYAAVIVLAVPFQWSLAWLFAAACHEFFHCLALILCGKPIESVTVDICGAQIQTTDLRPMETVFCSLAGPMAGILLIFLCRTFPQIVICALFQTAFNLLPIYPLDGGRALGALMCLLLPNVWVKPAVKIIEVLTLAILFSVGVLSFFLWKLGLVPLLITALLAIQRHNRKIPCKWGARKVQ